jgi:hypothetical protein
LENVIYSETSLHERIANDVANIKTYSLSFFFVFFFLHASLSSVFVLRPIHLCCVALLSISFNFDDTNYSIPVLSIDTLLSFGGKFSRWLTSMALASFGGDQALTYGLEIQIQREIKSIPFTNSVCDAFVRISFATNNST